MPLCDSASRLPHPALVPGSAQLATQFLWPVVLDPRLGLPVIGKEAAPPSLALPQHEVRFAAGSAPDGGKEGHTAGVIPQRPGLAKLLIDVDDKDIAAAARTLEEDGAGTVSFNDHDALRVFGREAPRFALLRRRPNFCVSHSTEEAAADASRAANAYATARSSKEPLEG